MLSEVEACSRVGKVGCLSEKGAKQVNWREF